ncbi:hypothetical protein Tco_0374351 [Tanacetum coccineum]
MFAPETDETIHLAEESRSKLSDLIKPFDYTTQFNIGPSAKEILELEHQPTLEYLKKNLETFKQMLKEEMVEDLRYFKSLEKEVESIQSQLDLQRTQFSNENDCLLREYFYNDHMNAILDIFTTLDEYSDLSCKYLEKCEESENLAMELCKSKT